MLVPAEVWTVAKAEQGSAVLIKPIGSEVAVPIFIGSLEAQAILIGLANHKMPRPLTHDLLLSTLRELDAKISRIEITELKEGTFYARLILNRNGNDLIMDSRPSDCVALAVRAKCPIFIDEGVVDEAGIPISSSEEKQSSKSMEIQSQITYLEDELKKAVEDSGRNQIIVIGIEAHVCVLQTAIDLVSLGYEVHVPHDAVNSRRPADKDWALHRMAAAGAIITATESALFELLERCDTSDFKTVAKLIKRIPVL